MRVGSENRQAGEEILSRFSLPAWVLAALAMRAGRVGSENRQAGEKILSR